MTFDASASADPDGQITAYAWNFGDLTLGSGQVTPHSYTMAGTYNVSLTVTDNESFTSTAYRDIVVQPGPPGAPVARFVVSPSPVDPDVPVTFNASTSYDPNGYIVSYAWDFGDLSPAGSGVTTMHTYLFHGVYTAILNVTDNQGLSSTATHQLVVRNRAPTIFSSIPSLASLTVNSGTILIFSVSTSDPDGDAQSYTWRTDGSVVGGNTNVLTFTAGALGMHTVNVTVSDGSLAAWHEWTVTVASPSFLSSAWPFMLLAFVVLGAVVFVWWTRRRRRPDQPPPPPR